MQEDRLRLSLNTENLEQMEDLQVSNIHTLTIQQKKVLELRAILENEELSRSSSPANVQSVEYKKSICSPTVNLKEATRMLLERRADFKIGDQSPRLTPTTVSVGLVKAHKTPPIVSLDLGMSACSSPTLQGSPFNEPRPLKYHNTKFEEISGYLNKRSDKFGAQWKRRYFVLQNGIVYYFKDRHDSEMPAAEPIGYIQLRKVRMAQFVEDQKSDYPYQLKLSSMDGVCTLAAEKTDDLNEWIVAIDQLIQQTVDNCSKQFESCRQNVVRGYLEKHYRGLVEKRFYELEGSELRSYNNSKKVGLIKSMNLSADLWELELPVGLDEDLPIKHHPSTENLRQLYTNAVNRRLKEGYRFGLHTTNDDDAEKKSIWFKCSSPKEYEIWIDKLSVICSVYHRSESVLQRMAYDLLFELEMQVQDIHLQNAKSLEFLSAYLEHPALRYQSSIISESLITLPSTQMQMEAIQINKAVLLFTSTEVNQNAINYHVNLAQALIKTCLPHNLLQMELLMQIVKQLIHVPFPNAAYQTWQLLILCLSVFTTSGWGSLKNVLLDYTRVIFRWLAKSQSLDEDSTYFLAKSKQLLTAWYKRDVKQCGRLHPPSSTEVLSILQSVQVKSISIAVKIASGSVQMFNIFSDTTAKQLCDSVLKKIGLGNGSEGCRMLPSDCFAFYISLHAYNGHYESPYGNKIMVKHDELIADLLWQHENNVKHQMGSCMSCSEFLLELKVCKVPLITTVNNQPNYVLDAIYLSEPAENYYLTNMTLQEKMFLAKQLHEQVVSGWFPCSSFVSETFAALQAQISYGDYFTVNNPDLLQMIQHTLLPKQQSTKAAKEPVINERMSFVKKLKSTMIHLPINSSMFLQTKLTKSNDIRVMEGRREMFHISTPLTSQATEVSIDKVQKIWQSLRGLSQLKCLDIYLYHILQWEYTLCRVWKVQLQSACLPAKSSLMIVAHDAIIFADTLNQQEGRIVVPFEELKTCRVNENSQGLILLQRRSGFKICQHTVKSKAYYEIAFIVQGCISL